MEHLLSRRLANEKGMRELKIEMLYPTWNSFHSRRSAIESFMQPRCRWNYTLA